MIDIRKILIIFVIGILYAIFVQSLIEAIHPSPQYDDFCDERYRPIPVAEKIGTQERVTCQTIEVPECEKEGYPKYDYDSNGCPTKAACNYCNRDLGEAQKDYNGIVFIISSLLGLLAIGVALYLPINSNDLNEWVATGFILGGLISLFIGTARYYGDMVRIMRPIVLFLELVIVIYIAYKQLGNLKKQNKK